MNDVDQSLCDSITPHDTAKDIDKDRRNLGIRRDKLKGTLDSFRCGTSTNVEEVGWCTTVQFDDIHSGHSKTGTIDKAADITIELDEVESVSRKVSNC